MDAMGEGGAKRAESESDRFKIFLTFCYPLVFLSLFSLSHVHAAHAYAPLIVRLQASRRVCSHSHTMHAVASQSAHTHEQTLSCTREAVSMTFSTTRNPSRAHAHAVGSDSIDVARFRRLI
eukprot:6205545-Pleurochrysis_carterae.AAC.1